MADADDILNALGNAAIAPKKVIVDGRSAEAHDLEQVIAAAKYVAQSSATTKNHLGVHFRQLVPGGCG